MFDPTKNSSSNYGIDLNKIKSNFQAYRSNTSDNTSDNKVYTGGTPNFDESLGRYKSTYEPVKASQYKSKYSDNIKNYLNSYDSKTTNTTNSTSNTNNNRTTNINANTSTDNNYDQTAGSKGDMITNFGDNANIKNSSIGNDYSVNIAGIGDGFSNMQGAAAYSALNNNQHERSRSQLNGMARADQASEAAANITGAKESAANLYNSVGYSQNYWGKKAEAQQNFYLGDIFKMQAPEYQFQDKVADPFANDRTEQITEDAMDKIKD